MTFYEAALRILESEGRPLHFLEITEKSIAQNLLSHVGKTPEQTMLSRLAAMARRTRDRRVIVTAKDTFALVDWALPEDPEALAQTGVPEPHPEEELPPLRPAERHPDARMDNVRATGRGERKRRHEEEEVRGRRRRFPPLPEVVFEILSEVGMALRPEEIVARSRERELAGEDVTPTQMLTALLEDNQRRIDVGRRPQFLFSQETGQVNLERAGAPSDAPPLELQAAFAAALGIPLEGGRPVLARVPHAAEEKGEVGELREAVRTAAKDARRALARALRRRLAELEVGTFEKAAVKMLHAHGFRELKVAKRSKEGPLLTARKKEGSVELRFAIRMLKGNSPIERRTVQELRRDLGHYSAQVGLLIGAGDVRGDGRAEAQSSGALVMLWCADALGEKFLEVRTGVTVTQVELFEIDERFFDVARLDAEEARRRREERQRERQQEAGAPERERPVAVVAEPAPEAAEPAATPAEGEVEQGGAEPVSEARAAAGEGAGEEPLDEEDEEDEEEGEGQDLAEASAFISGRVEGGPGEAAAPGERKRRRRRRRGRRGRGQRPAEGGSPAAAPTGGEGAALPDGQPPAEVAATPAAEPAPAAEAPPPAPPPGPSTDGEQA